MDPMFTEGRFKPTTQMKMLQAERQLDPKIDYDVEQAEKSVLKHTPVVDIRKRTGRDNDRRFRDKVQNDLVYEWTECIPKVKTQPPRVADWSKMTARTAGFGPRAGGHPPPLNHRKAASEASAAASRSPQPPPQEMELGAQPPPSQANSFTRSRLGLTPMFATLEVTPPPMRNLICQSELLAHGAELLGESISSLRQQSNANRTHLQTLTDTVNAISQQVQCTSASLTNDVINAELVSLKRDSNATRMDLDELQSVVMDLANAIQTQQDKLVGLGIHLPLPAIMDVRAQVRPSASEDPSDVPALRPASAVAVALAPTRLGARGSSGKGSFSFAPRFRPASAS